MSTKKTSNKVKKATLALTGGILGILVIFGVPIYMYLNYHLISKNTWISTQQKLDEQDKLIKEQNSKLADQEKTIKEQAAKLDTQSSNNNSNIVSKSADQKSLPAAVPAPKTVESKAPAPSPAVSAKPKYSLQDAYEEMGLPADSSHTTQVKDLAKQLTNYRNQHPQSNYTVAEALRDLGVPANATPSLFILKRAVDLIQSKN